MPRQGLLKVNNIVLKCAPTPFFLAKTSSLVVCRRAQIHLKASMILLTASLASFDIHISVEFAQLISRKATPWRDAIIVLRCTKVDKAFFFELDKGTMSKRGLRKSPLWRLPDRIPGPEPTLAPKGAKNWCRNSCAEHKDRPLRLFEPLCKDTGLAPHFSIGIKHLGFVFLRNLPFIEGGSALEIFRVDPLGRGPVHPRHEELVLRPFDSPFTDLLPL
mmetsp:Transcript_9254/g.22744  ORF Transcript_9254/g.22744 Transcript_9254/m.22744 type:complete len:218 (-) Transcript_9254:246-899(-)